MPMLTLGIFNTIEHAQPIGMFGKVRPLYNDPLIVNAGQPNVLLSRPDCFTRTTGKVLTSYKVVRFLLRLNGELVFANENTNGLVRQYLKKRSSFLSVTSNQLIDIMNKLNSRPRKTLGYKSPNELFFYSQ